ncbi:MAG: exo-alpha-sialidase [Actinobacteria bacterium]|nr:exo-alpha-sialidase [Actinomycetota bacterium]
MKRDLLRGTVAGAVGLLLAAAALTGSATAASADAGTAPRSVDPRPVGATGHRATTPGRVAPAPRAGEPAVHNELLRTVLADRDGEGAPEPALASLCQSFIGKPNPYGPPAPNVDQINGDGIVQAGTQLGCSTAQNETSIAVNPHNPRNLVAGANDYRVFNANEGRNDGTGWAYTTFDGGRSWTDVQLPRLTNATGATGVLSHMDAAGDPVLAFGPGNTVYYGNIVFSRSAPAPGGTEPASAITVNVSHDGGLHWDDPVVVRVDGVNPAGNPTPTRYFNDKVWMAADPESGRAYVTWTQFTDNPDGSYLESPIVVAGSRDFGRTFAPMTRVAPPMVGFTGGVTPYDQGSNPQVGRDGSLYVGYEASVCATLACDQLTDHDATVVATSRDGGRTFRQAVVDTNFDFPTNWDVGRSTLTGENFRINSFPQLGYDRDADRLWVTWADDRNGGYDAAGTSVRTNGDNLVATSRGGERWSTPTVVGTAQDEVFGAIAAHDGTVAVTSYTRRYDPSGVKLDYAYWTASSQDRLGRARIQRITTESSDPSIQFVGVGRVTGKELQGVFIGDYSAVALGTDLTLHPCWTDFRGSPGTTAPNQDAYSQAISLR